ncbi:Slam-dependent surface lipoprotein [Pseudoxanthomonas sp. JBR18]|uniref:Slam-dependent surface lipoprotein n=1 Tax=Pseudoxanthomonas sp. JBR18 TaxID=2969308 RepID=UPI002305AA85|nr:Slam-dependent surface lipoprotein [Pseudoxanthomonas sp. JBR18]WCE03599.1 hypothetical protein PJ250_16105 [Pseudoxanthomonas sp. JBR18]
MNIRNRMTTLAAAIAVFSIAGAAQAAIVGTQTATSGTPSIAVGESQVLGGPHTPGKAGIGISNFAGGLRVDFDGLTASSTSTSLGNNFTLYNLHDPTTPGTPGDPNDPPHNGLGDFNFVRVGTGDVWIGEWSTDGSPGYSNRQAYYVGDNAGTTLPTSTATYVAKGTNRGTILTGTLTATFGGTNTLTGSVAGGGLSIAVNASINSTNASFSGTAAGVGSAGAASGTTTGNFFGASAAALAGVANFGTGHAYNTAFGGTK